ncbi:hypothetical protein JTE90_024162 [Oedothorax gibbosus]|uniref:Ankyrin n=1 Tax=Oedothorax gibbosus TaxID=931172 RepID=A0AAV6TRE7_9ARAC|nr:hypothetical protein JTE90_024162 [Oedothorax gibbosus]
MMDLQKEEGILEQKFDEGIEKGKIEVAKAMLAEGGSSSKSDLEDNLSREELSSLIDGEDANERLPLRDVRSFPRKKSSTFSSKSPDGESTPSDEKLGSSVTGNKATKNSAEHTDVFRFSPVNENRESSVIAEDRGSSTKNKEINVEHQDNHPEKRFMSMPNQGLRNKSNSNRASDLACTINGSNTNEVPDIKVMKPSEEYHSGGHLNHELGSTSNLNRADGSGGNMNEEPHATTDTVVKFYDYYLGSLSLQLFNICEEKNIDKARFYQKINFLYENGRLYDVLFSQNKEGDTLLHVAIKKNDVDLTKEVLRILKRPYNSNDSYKYRYFKDKEESEKPLSKVINTKNREKKDVITLLIEGDNPECISAVFKYLIRENFNRKNEEGYAPLHEAMRLKSSNAVEKLLESEHVEVELRDESLHKAYNYVYDEEITQLFINYYNNKINDLHKRLVDSNRKLAQTEHNLSKRKSIFAYSGVASFFAQISKVICDIITERIPLLNNVLSVTASPPGLMVYLIH